MILPVFRRLFVIFGLVHNVYDIKLNRYTLSQRLTLYGIGISILIQTFNSFSFYVRRKYISQALLTVRPVSVMSNIIVAFDCCIWIIMCSTPILSVTIRRTRICRIMNHFLRYDQKYQIECQEMADTMFQNRMHRLYKWFGSLVLFGNCFVGLYNYGLTPITAFTMISHYFLTAQFVLGNSYELMFFEKLQLNFLMLELKLAKIDKSNLSRGVKICIKNHSRLVSLARKATNVFGTNKIVCLASLTILISVYWFYTYDHLRSVVPTVVWQMILSMVFVVCHSWDRMSSKVSLV